MAGGKLEVQIGADITDFEKKLKEVEFDIKELSKVKLDRLKLGLDTTEINAQIKDAKNNLNGLRGALKDTGNAIGKDFTQKTGNGSNALLQFSRIAQDAPFGIIGIGNNITATVESFSYLKQATGSTGGALKALGQSIVGSGGILLGVSLLTTGLTYLAQSGLTIGDVMDKLTGETDAYADALKKANEQAFNDSGVVSSIKNVNDLTNEVKLAKEGFIDKSKVVDHYNETMGKTTGIVQTLDQVEQQLVKNGPAYIQMQLYKAVASIANKEAAEELLKTEKAQVTNQKKYQSTFAQFLGLLQGTPAAYIANVLGEESRQEAISESTNAMKANIKIGEKYNKMAAEIAKTFGFNFFGDTEIPKPKKTFNTPQVSGIGSTILPAPIIDPKGQQILATTLKGYANTIKTGTAEMILLLQEFNAQANELILNTISNTFGNLGTAIGEALANGGNVLQALGETVISAFAGFLSSMGDLLIKYGTLAVLKGKLDLAIASGGPVAIAAGVAAIAVGVALKAAGAAIGSFAKSGGNASVSSGSTANNSSFTSSGFASRGVDGGTVVFEIAGQKLVGVLSNTLNANRRLGGQLGL